MADLERLLREYREQYRSGEGADPRPWLERVEGPEREELRGRIEEFLEEAPRRSWDAAAFEGSLSAKALSGLDQSLQGASGAWPMLLPQLRNRAEISRADLVDRLAEGLGHADQREKVAGYYNQMEQGLLPASGVRTGVLEALGAIVGTTAGYLRSAGAAMSVSGSEGESQAAVFARKARPDPSYESFSRADSDAARESRSPEPDEVDDLFTGGHNPDRG